MPPGRKKGQTKAQTTEEPLTEIERERAKTMMRNNQKLQSLGLTALASIVNKSFSKSKSVTRENSGSLYEPEEVEDMEHGVVDKAMQVSQDTIISTGGTRGSKRVMPPVVQDQPSRMTRQRTREQSSTEEGLNDTSPNTQANDEIQMCNENELNDARDEPIRGRSMGKHLDKLSRGLNTKIPVVIVEGKRRPEAPIQAAKLASESGIIVRQHLPIYTRWKDYKNDEAVRIDFRGKVAAKFSMDINNNAVKDACDDLLKCRQRNMRHQLKKAFFDGALAHQVPTKSPVPTMTDDQWQALVDMWSNPKHKEKCAKAKLSREKVRFPQKTGSRCFIAHAHVAKQEKYKDAPPTAIDLFKDTHCSSKTGLSEPVRQAIAQMEAIIAEPTEEGQVQKTHVEAVAQVLQSSSFLKNVGFEEAAPKRSAKAAAAARVEELEAEVEAEKKGAAVLRDKVDSQQDEIDTLKKKVEESDAVREKQSEQIENLQKQAEENKKQSDETNALLRRLLSLNRE